MDSQPHTLAGRTTDVLAHLPRGWLILGLALLSWGALGALIYAVRMAWMQLF